MSATGELVRLFLRLGATAFGGPAAHIALMRGEVVERRRWLTEQEFLDYLGATNLIPGPNSTELALHVGHARAGWIGLLAAGLAFIVPAAAIVGGLAWAYVRFGSLPDAARALYGVKAVVMAIVGHALWKLGRTALTDLPRALVALAAVAALAAGAHELLVLAGAAAAMIAIRRAGVPALPMVLALQLPSTSAAAAAASASLSGVFLIFLKIGSVLFGSGYVLMAFLRADLVERLHWITERQLLDAVAVGQITPGPLFTTATFIGYLVAGAPGAVVATAGIFLPAFVFVGLSGPLIPRLRRSPSAGAALDGVNAASLALMALVTLQLGRTAIVDWLTALLALASLGALIRTRINPMWLTVTGAVVGWVAG